MARLPDMEAMAIFATVVETRGITAAAKALSLSPPTISKALARLERRLGTPLFHRTSRRLTLTDAGGELAARAGRLLAEAEAAEAALLEQASSPRGRVRLTAPMSFGVRAVAPLLPAFMARYPDISIDLSLTDAMVDLVAEGFDLALRIADLPDSSLRARRLRPIRRVAVAAPAYLDRHGRPEHPSELMAHACFGYAYLQTRGAWTFLNDEGEEVSVRPEGPLRVNNGEAAMPALLAGLGITDAPEFLLDDLLESGRLEQVLPRWRRPEASLFLLLPPGKLQPARIRAVADYLTSMLVKRPSGPPPMA
ncbi:MAG TPA: LysR family transcriptional regulator [Rhodopila sp.]|uniref:LysR family transcriptional regulator n=1 Tax=Rhodopila sp. TaxID=2480087 RepID=UPI002C83E27D|nr:LysR family transcriptional regulator [Rhodopila sp.]HVY15546.1 LysR family transcriptional regulator [Rhodopila sp.]